MPLTPLPDTDEGITGLDFDHIEEAKEALDDVVQSGRLDFTAAIAVAQAHALISIAQSLETLAIGSELDEDEYAISVINIGEVVSHDVPSINDFYREG